MTETAPRIVELRYEDEALAALDLPGGRMEVLRGVGSGLCVDAGGRIWGVGDRGPNLKVGLAVERYGLTALARHAGLDGAKVMPCPEIGPAISELAVQGDRVVIVRSFPIRDREGRPLSGFPTPGGGHSVAEPAITLDGQAIPPDPSGADSEGIAPAADGGFWVGDEYGPSLLRIAADGEVIARWVPEGCEALFEGGRYPVLGVLPAIAARRRLNRGFEAL
ncbi:MAG TPA: esterase-like activity of phytase family protein, partial [Sphingomonas sp.]